MIKTDNDVFYLSAGEACYIFGAKGGTPKTLYFGKRIEYEDDIAALGYSAFGDELEVKSAYRDGKPIKVVLDFCDARILNAKPCDGATLDGGKTLAVTLRDKKNMLSAVLYYTAYPRGGFTRSATVTNEGCGTVKAELALAVSLGGVFSAVTVNADGNIDISGSGESCGTGIYNYAALSANDGADAYAVMCPFADGRVTAACGNGAKIFCGNGTAEIPAGGQYRTAELLAVYSDNGLDGTSRVFHDILREHMRGNASARRSHTVLFFPHGDKSAACAAARSACEMGFDVLAVNAGDYTAAELKAVAAACKSEGLEFGLRINLSGIKQNSALCRAEYKENGGYCRVDFSDPSAAAAFASAVEKETLVADAKYVVFDTANALDIPTARTVFGIHKKLNESSDIKCEWGIVQGGMPNALSLCYPLCMLRNAVGLSPADAFKTRFDCATFGLLSYEFDPAVPDDNIKTAVRAQILSYQDDAPIVTGGDLYRPNTMCRIAVTKDKSKAYAVCLTDGNSERVRFLGLDERNLYRVRELDKIFSGAALVRCGIVLPSDAKGTAVFHFRQVADYFQ